MKRKFMPGSALKLSVFSFIAVTATAFLINACNKPCKQNPATEPAAATANNAPAPVVQNKTLSQVVTVGDIRKSDDGTYTRVIFNENAQIFMLRDAAVIAQLQDAYNAKTVIKATFNPWSGTVLAVNNTSADEAVRYSSRPVVNNPGLYQRVNLAVSDPVDPSLAVLNTTTPGLTNVIPDFATAQMMFDYITHQDCALAGPYAIDHCIPFQYCEDGCYARAHKMCWIINNTYHYATHKIFSFAVGGSSLSVKAEKWRGCCITWWFHVTALVNIKTPAGVKAYVFDPAMFDQPVPLATWLHAQANPACSGSAGVTSFNIQPTSSYSPASFGDTTTFVTDPTYSNTNSTLMGYASLHTCY